MEPIAVIGMACRVPGAGDLESFWRNTITGVQARTELSRERLLAAGAPAQEIDDPEYVAAAYLLEEMEGFDAGLFGMTPREASLTDPQHRLFLELCHAALENAGWNPAVFPGDIAVYGGRGMETYRWNHLYRNAEVMSLFDHTTLGVGNHADTFTTLVSHKLDLRGPSVGVYTACSTSLVAIHFAAEALRAGECDMALAGGTNIELPAERGYRYREGASVSADGYARPFDAQATGTVWGSGGGAVVLKRLEDALADGDQVRAVIRGDAVNNDGAAKAGFTAPSVQGQAAVIASALAVAQASPRDVTYVETFGLGSPLSDQIEVEALRKVFSHASGERQWCALGSVKSNIGHLSQGAGVVSFIKTVLALQNKVIPPTAGFAQAHPDLDLAQSPFYVNASLAGWENDAGPRLAAVSAFGVGGTNAHVLLEEYAQPPHLSAPPAEQLLQVSARSATALDAAVRRLASHLEQAGECDLADVAYTLRVGRVEHAYRAAVVASDPASAATALRALRHRGDAVAAPPPRVVAIFPNEGACETWQSLGVEPAAMIGVGAGELAAATLAEVFSAETGQHLAQLRERLLASAPTGATLGISGAPDRFDLPDGVYLTAVNGPSASVVCGNDPDLGKFADQLAAQGITARRLAGRQPMPMPGIAEEFAQAVMQASPMPPAKPYLSSVTGQPVTAQQVTDPGHWARYLQGTVLFGDCLRAALGAPGAIVVEWGTGQLARLASQYQPSHAPRPVALQPDPLRAAGRLWALGVPVKLECTGKRVALPGYPYERSRHWIEPDAVTPQTLPSAQQPAVAQDPTTGLAAIWVQLLGVEAVTAEDDFFELGGTSLLAVQLIARVREVYGVRLPTRSIFDTPTVRGMAAKVAQLRAAAGK